MLQQWLAGTMVVFAAVYALFYWMPPGLRRRLGWLQKKRGDKPGCGACSSCGNCGATAKADVAEADGRQLLWMKPRR